MQIVVGFGLIVFLFFISIAPSAFAWERSSSSVPPDSTYYRDIDKLVAFGLVTSPILGQRSYPRSEFARMTAEAMNKLDEKRQHYVGNNSLSDFDAWKKKRWQIEVSMKRLKREFREELVDMGAIEGERMRYRVHPFEKLVIYGRYLNSPPTTIPPNNGRGSIDAQINPLGDYNLGRNAVDGGTNAVEPVARFQMGKYFSAYARPRFEVDMPRNGDMSGHAYLQNGYGTFRAGNFSLKAGRDSMLWGFGERGSLLYSTNPRPMDGVWVTNPAPARLPWVFKYLGRWRYTLYGINLGPDRPRKWGWLAGYKFSLAPINYLELGFGHAVMIGGEGAATPSFVDVIGEFAGFRPAGTSPASANLSNHMFEIDLLIRIVPLRGTEIYGNMVIDDKWKSIKKTLVHGCSYLAGVYVPALNPSGSVDARFEYVRTSPLQYRHSLYADGYTLNRKLIGSDAGSDADTLHLLVRHTLSQKLWYGVTLDWDYRRSNTYTELRNPNGTAGDVVKIASGPTEQRYRGVFDLNWMLRRHLRLNFSAGFERVKNIFYTAGDDRNNYLAAASLEIDLDRFFGFAGN